MACSVGSACASGSTELSPTLRAMGLPNDIVASFLRFSLGATTTEAEIDEAVAADLACLPGIGRITAGVSGLRVRRQGRTGERR